MLPFRSSHVAAISKLGLEIKVLLLLNTGTAIHAYLPVSLGGTNKAWQKS